MISRQPLNAATLDFLDRIGLRHPILQAPMAGVSTPQMAAAVSNAGGLGALGLGAATVDAAQDAIRHLKALSDAPFNLNFFCHAPPERDPEREARWIARAAPLFARFAAPPPDALSQIYSSFREDDGFLDLLLTERPAVASFHFGLPRLDQIDALRDAGIYLIASATSPKEALEIEAAGLDAIVAQGWQAGGHRGIFDPGAPDERLSTAALLEQLSGRVSVPLIAAGGLMDGADIACSLAGGAVAAQLGTAFIACPESSADAPYREALAQGRDTVMTSVISGRPARCLENDFTRWGAAVPDDDIPAYPCCYDLGKALNSAARQQGEGGFGAQWAGAGVARCRALSSTELVQRLIDELHAALSKSTGSSGEG